MWKWRKRERSSSTTILQWKPNLQPILPPCLRPSFLTLATPSSIHTLLPILPPSLLPVIPTNHLPMSRCLSKTLPAAAPFLLPYPTFVFLIVLITERFLLACLLQQTRSLFRIHHFSIHINRLLLHHHHLTLQIRFAQPHSSQWQIHNLLSLLYQIRIASRLPKQLPAQRQRRHSQHQHRHPVIEVRPQQRNRLHFPQQFRQRDLAVKRIGELRSHRIRSNLPAAGWNSGKTGKTGSDTARSPRRPARRRRNDADRARRRWAEARKARKTRGRSRERHS